MYNLVLDLAGKIVRSDFVPDVIVGVSRGGWVPARVLCDLLNTPVLASLSVGSYSGIYEKKSRPILTQSLSASVSRKRVLVVDEVVDTGESLKLAKEHVTKRRAEEVRTATMYEKPWSASEPDYHGRKTSSWIVFPWELRETIRSLATGTVWEKRRELDELEHARLSAAQTRRLLNKILEKNE